MNSILALFLTGGLLISTLTGCGTQIIESPKVDDPVVVEKPVEVKPVVTENPDIVDGGFFNLNNETSYNTVEDLFDIVKKDGENNMISPLSLQLALGMAAAGADGETRAELEKFMNCDSGTLANKSFKLFESIDEMVEDEDSKTKLSIANSLWIDEGMRTSYISSFEDVLRADFRADIKEAVLSNSVDEINKWCDDKTNGMIKKVVDEISPDTKSILLNAVYFAGIWHDPFEKNLTHKADFTLSNGDKIKVDMMSGEGDRYYETDNAFAVKKRYEDGFSFVAISSKEGKSEVNVKELFENEVDCTDIYLYLPKFKFDGSYSMTSALNQLGVNKAFEPGLADFSNMSTAPYFISEVFQKTAVEMDEVGTKAAAVTGIMMETCSVEMGKVVNVILDKPFTFMIVDSEDNILFYGNIENPNK